MSQLIESAEMKLHDSGRSADCALDEEIEELRPKIGNLRNLAEKLVKMFVGQKSDVEPEMEILGQRYAQLNFRLNLFGFFIILFGKNVRHEDFKSFDRSSSNSDF